MTKLTEVPLKTAAINSMVAAKVVKLPTLVAATIGQH